MVAMGWTPPSGREPAALDPALIDQDDPEYDSSYEAFYGEHAGGWKFTFGKHKGERMNEVPYSYLKFCYNKLKNARVYQEAFQRYRNGLLDILQDKYDDFRVPLGKRHRGKRLRECRDKPWMTWLISWANRHEVVKDKYDIFLQALRKYLDSPRHQGVYRDIGERLLPEEYEGDLEGEDEYDKEEYSQEDIDDADENGNLRDFVVDDDVVEYEDDASQRSILDDTEDEDANSRTRRSHTNQSDSNDDDSDSCSGSDSGSDSDDSDNSLVSDNADYIDHDPFFATPRKWHLKSDGPLPEHLHLEGSLSHSPRLERNSSRTFQTVTQTPRKKRIVVLLPTPTRTPCTNKKHIMSALCSGDPSPKLQSRGYTRTRVLMSDTESDCASDEDEELGQSVKANVESAQTFQPRRRMNAVYLPQTPTKRATQKASATLATPQTDAVCDSEDDTPLPELYKRYASGNGSDVWTPKSIKHSKGASQKALQPILPPTPAPTPARKKRKAQEAIESDSEYVDSISPRRYAQRMESLRTRNSQRRKE